MPSFLRVKRRCKTQDYQRLVISAQPVSRTIINILKGNSTESLFDATLAGKERLIRKAITSYVGVSSDFTGLSPRMLAALYLTILLIWQSPKLPL